MVEGNRPLLVGYAVNVGINLRDLGRAGVLGTNLLQGKSIPP